jgi:hypothetical protein
MRVAVGLMSGFSFGHALVVQAKQLFTPTSYRTSMPHRASSRSIPGMSLTVEFEFNLLNPNLMAAPCAVPIIE